MFRHIKFVLLRAWVRLNDKLQRDADYLMSIPNPTYWE